MSASQWRLPCLAACCLAAASASASPSGAPPDAPSLHALLPDRIRQAGVLVVGTDAHHPPCESYADDDETIVGFEPDLWNALGTALGVKVRAMSVDFGGLIPGVQAGRFDIAMECMSDSPAREQEVTFVDFAHATASVYTLADDGTIGTDPSSLCGLHGGVQVGTDFSASLHGFSAACIKAGRKPISIAEYASDGAVVLALYSGRVDFVLNDRNAAKQMQEHAPRKLRAIDVGFPIMTIGVAVARDGALVRPVLEAMRALYANGVYASIMRKWGIAELSLQAPGVDLARRP